MSHTTKNTESNDFSQFGEQKVILDFFKDIKGTFLDIGAYNGIWCSNTHALALLDWDGVCVEANPEMFINLIDTYTGNDRIKNVNACIGLESKLVKLHLADCVTSTDLNHIKQFNIEAKECVTIYVPQITIEWIANEISSYFDFVNIDVEGGSADLFLPVIETFIPMLICVEHDHKEKELEQIAVSNNYTRIYSNGVNLIYKRNG
jgi:FkbM family methyltransferase